MPRAVQKLQPSVPGPLRTVPAAEAGSPDQTEIEQLQLCKLKTLLKEIIPANSFYARKLAGHGSDLEIRNPEDFCRKVPFTFRHELVRDRLENPPYGTNLTYPLERYVRCHQTSGTTTVPIRWLDTKETWDQIVENWVQIL